MRAVRSILPLTARAALNLQDEGSTNKKKIRDCSIDHGVVKEPRSLFAIVSALVDRMRRLY